MPAAFLRPAPAPGLIWRNPRSHLLRMLETLEKRITMNTPLHHSFTELFAQLGLATDEAGIGRFLTAHRPLAADVALADAAFWNPSQAAFLREEILDDADWAEVVDQLNAALRAA